MLKLSYSVGICQIFFASPHCADLIYTVSAAIVVRPNRRWFVEKKYRFATGKTQYFLAFSAQQCYNRQEKIFTEVIP
jgi:hypothetical protein